jgi:hypothetical protein
VDIVRPTVDLVALERAPSHAGRVFPTPHYGCVRGGVPVESIGTRTNISLWLR